MSWFSSYLSDRVQCTRVEGCLSGPRRMDSGVPQGSILGPLLFICYINDLPSFLQSSQAFFYADDTALVVNGKNVVDINAKLCLDFTVVTNWFTANKLSVNTAKTKCMLFSTNRYPQKDEPLKVESDCTVDNLLEPVDHFKYLGVHLDIATNWPKRSGAELIS